MRPLLGFLPLLLGCRAGRVFDLERPSWGDRSESVELETRSIAVRRAAPVVPMILLDADGAYFNATASAECLLPTDAADASAWQGCGELSLRGTQAVLAARAAGVPTQHFDVDFPLEGVASIGTADLPAALARAPEWEVRVVAPGLPAGPWTRPPIRRAP